MKDTPRTDAAEYESQDEPAAKLGAVDVEFARQLERELNAANDRIKRLEEELMNAKNKYAALVADVALYEDRGERIKRLEQTLEAVTDKLDNAWGIYMQFKEAKP
jgi:predicted  nucleic acid-binding Zn-ribbon protein